MIAVMSFSSTPRRADSRAVPTCCSAVNGRMNDSRSCIISKFLDLALCVD